MKYLNALMFYLLFALVGCGDEQNSWPRRTFDEKSWIEAPEAQRYVFVRDLIDRKQLLRMSKSEVVRILGKPSYEHPSHAYITYVIRAESSDFYVLDIRFEQQANNLIVKKVGVRPM